MDYNIITADTHMDVTWLPGDMFVKGAPDALKDKMPYVNNKNGKAQWEIEGEFMCWVGGRGPHRRLWRLCGRRIESTWTAWPMSVSSTASKMASTIPQTPTSGSRTWT